LKRDGPEPGPDARTVALISNPGNEGEKEEKGANDGERVPQIFEASDVVDHAEGNHVTRDSDGGPRRLLRGQVGIETNDEDVADTVEAAGHGKQRGVGQLGETARSNMRAEEQPADHESERLKVCRHFRRFAEADQCVRRGGESGDQHQETEFGSTTGDRGDRDPHRITSSSFGW
jgi:hypothetical protein